MNEVIWWRRVGNLTYMIWITGTVIIEFGILSQSQTLVQHFAMALVLHVFSYSVQGIEGSAAIVAPQANVI